MAIRCSANCEHNKNGWCSLDCIEIDERRICTDFQPMGDYNATTVYGKVEGEFLTIGGVKTVNLKNLLKEYEGKRVWIIIIIEDGVIR